MSIQYKIIFGYMVLIVAIIGMIIIMVRERNRVLVIETEAQTIHRVQDVYKRQGIIRRSSVDYRERIAHLEGKPHFHLHYADMGD